MKSITGFYIKGDLYLPKEIVLITTPAWPDKFGDLLIHRSTMEMINQGLYIDEFLNRFANGDFGMGAGQGGVDIKEWSGVYETMQGPLYIRSRSGKTAVLNWMDR